MSKLDKEEGSTNIFNKYIWDNTRKNLLLDFSNKRTALLQQEKALNQANKKNAHLESMMNVISRSWKQLDHDSHLLVQLLEKKLGYDEASKTETSQTNQSKNTTSSDLAHLHLNRHLTSYDPSIDPLLQPNSYISQEEFIKEAQEISKSLYRKSIRIQKHLYTSSLKYNLKIDESVNLLPEAEDELLKDSLQNLGSDSESDDEETEEVKREMGKLESTWGSKLEETVSSHVKFTLELITKLASYLETTSTPTQKDATENENTLNENNPFWQDARHAYAMALKFNESLKEQKIIAIKLQNRIRELTQMCWKYQKERDELAIQLSEVNREAISIEMNQKNSLEIKRLTQQLAESDKIRVGLEENLNDLSAKLLEHDSILSTKLENSPKDVESDQTVSRESYENDIEKLKKQIEIQKKSLSLYEEEAIKKIQQAVTEANADISALRSQNNDLKKIIKLSENDKSQIKNLTSTLESTQVMLDTYKSKISYLNTRIESFEKNAKLYENRTKSDTTSSSNEDSNLEALKNLQAELQYSKDEITQLLSEIDIISTNEMKLMKTNEDLLAKIKQADHLRETAFHENLNLQFQHEELKKKYDRLLAQHTEYKLNAEKNFHLFFTEMKTSEKKNKDYCTELENNFSRLSKEYDTLIKKKQSDEDILNKKLQAIESLNEFNKKTLKKVIQQYEDIIKEKKRKRVESNDDEAGDKKKPKKEDVSDSSDAKRAAEFNKEQSQMLDMTLHMLRCSVCKDRFKNVMLTRCHHLFCKDCVDENLKTRLRKCPACGDRFGQDDVINIYFTN